MGVKSQIVALQEAIEQFGQEGMEAMGADASTGLPQDFSDRRDVGAVLPWPATAEWRGADGGATGWWPYAGCR